MSQRNPPPSPFDTQDIKTIDMVIAQSPTYFEKTNRTYEAVFGNGKPGMDEDLRAVRRDVDEILRLIKESNPQETKGRVDMLLKLAWVVVTGGLGYAVVEIFKLI